MTNPRNINTILAPALVAAFGLSVQPAVAQKLPEAQVPAAVTAHFKKTWPQAADVKWELKGTQYEVDFETGLLGQDHEAWYDGSGKLLKHEEEVSAADLPAAVNATIQREFAGSRVDDVDRITIDDASSYIVELKGTQKWKVVFDANGAVKEKRAD